MNYRHAFHAGNFADVVKHAVLTRILVYLHGKATPFRVLDTHAGAGLYDLTSDEARRGGEWQAGIGRLLPHAAAPAARTPPAGVAMGGPAGSDLATAGLATAGLATEGLATHGSSAAPDLLSPYLDVVRAHNGAGGLALYPGSPLIARALMRPQDRLVACELEPQAHAALLESLRGDPQGRVVQIDGWTALGAYLPPKERRGVVLIDPPFEQPDEFARFAAAFGQAYAKWPTGIYILWYPIKARGSADRLCAAVADIAPKNICVEITVAPPDGIPGLRSAGLMVVNPPWTLASELDVLMPWLSARLAQAGSGSFRVETIVPALRRPSYENARPMKK